MMIPCLLCNKTLENIHSGAGNQPLNGIEFYTHGHYGTAFFDPMNGDTIAINICDSCLEKNIDKIIHYSHGNNPKPYVHEE